MRYFLALALATTAFACGGSKKTGPAGGGSGVGSDVAAETCCCKSNPMTSEDGSPVFENGNRMECSTKQGECVDEVQCQASPQQPE